mmetsp:Transcript_36962/g.108960  ORF Transcript_36962/g.108960 Transcript_36962/m.108960 type:complete len:397 (-) Transcript_36962:288-1478(-)
MAMQHPADPLVGHAKYRLQQHLNSGSFGIVNLYRVIGTNENVAIKFLLRGDHVNKYVENEVLNHRILRHPHVIEFKEVFLTPQYIAIAMEYANFGNLFNYVQSAVRLQEPAARWFFQQLIIGLDYCHQKGVVNRDIKLENTLLQLVPNLPLPLLKICDFGYSKAHFASAPKSKVGTLAYMAPEVIQTADRYDGKMGDIWSCGIMLYVMLFGMYPFDASHAKPAPAAGQDPQKARTDGMISRIMHMQWSIPDEVPISPECRDLLLHLIVKDPKERYTMAQIQQHKWFVTNLPPDALLMNQQCLSNINYTGVQSEEDIKAVLSSAVMPVTTYSNEEEDMIEMTINEEVGMSGDYSNLPRDRPMGRQHGDGGAGQTSVAAPGKQGLQQHRAAAGQVDLL